MWVEPTGSLRRGQDLVDDLGLLVAADSSTTVLDALETSAEIGHVVRRETERIDVATDGVEAAIHCRTPRTAGALLLQLTGSQQHLDRLRHIAAERRCVLDDEGLRSLDGGHLPGSTERDIYAALGLPFIPPELRNEGDEIDAARDGRLPTLVSRADIRGDLHMHTHWSDGRDSIDTRPSDPTRCELLASSPEESPPGRC